MKLASVSRKNLVAADSRNFIMEKQQQWKTSATILLATLKLITKETAGERQANERIF